MKHPTFRIFALAALVFATSCSGPETISKAPVETISTHETVEIVWESDMPSALERARNEGKPVLVNFYADWCVWCKRLETTTLKDAKVAWALHNKVVPLSLNVDGDGKELSNEYEVDGLPTIIVLDAGGRELGRIPGYMPPDSFLEQVEHFIQQS